MKVLSQQSMKVIRSQALTGSFAGYPTQHLMQYIPNDKQH